MRSAIMVPTTATWYLLSALLPLATSAPQAGQQAGKPNIVWFLTDDQVSPLVPVACRTVLCLRPLQLCSLGHRSRALILGRAQDQELGGSFPPAAPNGATPMPKTKALMADMGATANSFYIHTPICNPVSVHCT